MDISVDVKGYILDTLCRDTYYERGKLLCHEKCKIHVVVMWGLIKYFIPLKIKCFIVYNIWKRIWKVVVHVVLRCLGLSCLELINKQNSNLYEILQ